MIRNAAGSFASCAELKPSARSMRPTGAEGEDDVELADALTVMMLGRSSGRPDPRYDRPGALCVDLSIGRGNVPKGFPLAGAAVIALDGLGGALDDRRLSRPATAMASCWPGRSHSAGSWPSAWTAAAST